jgi:diadenosine tetraphosphate (Ap4A) HIT family hydrolase
MTTFGHPATLVAESAEWVLLTRPRQVTLGSMVLVCKEAVTRFGDASPAAFAGLQPLVQRIEATLRGFVAYEKINYLMLMMVDPDVHFHVIPRYSGTRTWNGLAFDDAGWPGPPNLGSGHALEAAALEALTADLRKAWREAGA